LTQRASLHGVDETREIAFLARRFTKAIGAVTAGKLDFGPWKQIFYGEFDGGRRKRVLIKIIGE